MTSPKCRCCCFSLKKKRTHLSRIGFTMGQRLLRICKCRKMIAHFVELVCLDSGGHGSMSIIHGTLSMLVFTPSEPFLVYCFLPFLPNGFPTNACIACHIHVLCKFYVCVCVSMYNWIPSSNLLLLLWKFAQNWSLWFAVGWCSILLTRY